MLSDLIRKNRSYRRFYEDVPISGEDLKGFIGMARLSASARNMQSLKYVISSTPGMNEKIFRTLSWAGYLKDWPGPAPGERPSAYIVMMNDRNLSTHYYCDDGIAAQSILLAAVEKGFGGCMIASVRTGELAQLLDLPSHLEILMVIALGKPRERVVIEDLGDDGNIRYWRDAEQVHHVPKRPLDELVVKMV